MKFKDHKNVSRYLINSHKCRIKARHRWALIVGSVIPDIAFYTYFRGSFNGQKLKGHNYENTRECMRQLIEDIRKDDNYGIKRFFNVGKLLHYSADSFTYAHNSLFKGNISAHRAYEMKLHDRLEAVMNGTEEAALFAGAADIYTRIKELHDRYMNEVHGCQIDCAYIMSVTAFIYSMLAVNGYAEAEMAVAA